MNRPSSRPDPASAAPPAKPIRPRGRPPLDAAAQRERILSAAVEIFIARGFAAGSVSAIGAAAGVTKRTIYDLIGDKEEVFHAVCARLSATGDRIRLDVGITDMTVDDILAGMAATILDIALAPQGIAFSRMLAVETRRFPQLVLSVMDAARLEMHTAIADIFAELVARQRIGDVDPSQAADIFYDAIVGSRAMRAVLGYAEPHPSRAEIEARVGMILHGYLIRGTERDDGARK